MARREAPAVNANGVPSSSPGLFRSNETTLGPSHPTKPQVGFTRIDGHLGGGALNLRALFHELTRLLFHAALEGFFLGDAQLRRIFPHVFRDLHRAEVRAAHGTEVRALGTFLRQRFVVELAENKLPGKTSYLEI